MKVNFPSYNEYQAVLQSPTHCFNLNELKNSAIETDLWGLPRVRSGGFALTYKLSTRTRSLAVRCFHRHVPDRTTRYIAISNFLSANTSDVLLPIRYLPNGILVSGAWYPITFMNWVDGDTLEACVVKNVNNSALLKRLSAAFLHVVSELERLHISHGDLSHRNIIIHQERMVLVDYDGMFIPGMAGKKSCEVGNIHFQLPGRREEHFNENIDRFSEIVIYLALEALARNPSLWQRYETGGEGLLFQRDDFLNPYQSALLQEMEGLPDLKALVTQFRRICTSPINLVPRLSDFIESRPLDLPRNETRIDSPAALPVQDAALRISLLGKTGKVVTVVGKISEVFHGVSVSGGPHIFLNCGNWKHKCFTIVLWNESLQLLEATHMDPASYLDRWVSVTGILTAYERRPQIAVDSPTDIQILSSETEALNLLHHTPMPSRAPLSPSTRPASLTTSTLSASGALDQPPDTLARLEKLYTSSRTSSPAK